MQEYYDHPERYAGRFSDWLPYLTGLVNCIYWEPRYPKLVTRSELRTLDRDKSLRLRMISDITCDIDGSIELTVESTDQFDPILTYDLATDSMARKVEGPGISVLAVDNLPCELPRDATAHFGASLAPFLAELAGIDRSQPFEGISLREELKGAIIVWNGKLTPQYAYLESELPPA